MIYYGTKKQKEEISDIIDDIGVKIFDLNNENNSNNELIDDLENYKDYLYIKSRKKISIIKFNKRLNKIIYNIHHNIHSSNDILTSIIQNRIF